MNFFKPEDFYTTYKETTLTKEEQYFVANLANAKLERYGQVLYSTGIPENTYMPKNLCAIPKYKALIICVEKVDECKHPFSDTKAIAFYKDEKLDTVVFHCNCGAKVKPTAFEEIT